MKPIKVYIASKVKHAARWRQWRDNRTTIEIISTWIDEAEAGQTRDYSELWQRCISEAVEADCLVLYHEEGEELKGALVEVGAALAVGNRVYVCCKKDVFGSWVSHKLVTVCYSLPEVIAAIYSDYLTKKES